MKAQEKRIIVFASGASKGGGSGFQELVENSQTGVLHAHIVAVVSNYERGCVREKAEALGIPFVYFPGPWEVEEYKRIVEEHKPDLVSLSGWLKLVHGLPPGSQLTFIPPHFLDLAARECMGTMCMERPLRHLRVERQREAR